MNNVETLKNVIKSVNGVTFANIDLLTEVSLNGGKKNPMLGRVTKATTGMSVIIARSSSADVSYGSPAYENMVNRRLEKEGKAASFKSQGLQECYQVVDFPIIQHKTKGTEYIQVNCLNSGKTEYFLDGLHIDKSEIIGLKPSVSSGKQGGLESKVIIRTPKLENITAIRLMKETIE